MTSIKVRHEKLIALLKGMIILETLYNNQTATVSIEEEYSKDIQIRRV